MRKLLAIATACPRRLARGQDGFAVPFVTLLMIAVFAIVTVGVAASVRAQQGTVRDQDSKSALAVAEAGVSEALLHYNRIPTVPAQPCLVYTGSTIFAATAQGNGWCQPVTRTIEGGTFTYAVQPSPGALEIVSTGNAAGVARRVHVSAQSSSGQGIFLDATVKAQDGITMASNANVTADAATNGDITLDGNAVICGNAAHGVGRDVILNQNASHQCGGELEEPLILPAVNQGDAATNNDNDRFFSKDQLSSQPNKVEWDPLTRRLMLKQNTSLTLGGSVYSLCRLELTSNTNLFVAPGAKVTIYFDSPEECGILPGESQLQLDSNSVITANSNDGSSLALLFVGSATQATRITLMSNTQVEGACEHNFVVYAPRTAVDINSNSRFCGAVAGKTVHIDSFSQVFSSSATDSYTLPNVAPHYEVERFVECSSQSPGDPDAEC